MRFEVQHHSHFDAQGKLDADDWLMLPRADLPPGFALDAALVDEMVRQFCDAVVRAAPVPLHIAHDPQSMRILAPLGKTAMVLAEAEQLVDTHRAETSWRIGGGFLLAHRVSYGGRFYLGAEWHPDGALKLYSTIRRYPPRLVAYFGVPRGITVYERTQGRTYMKVQSSFLNAVARSLCAARPAST